MSQLSKKYKQKDLKVIAVNVRQGETPETVRQFAESQGLSGITFLQDGQGVAMDYEVRGVPATFFVNVLGEIEVKLVGFNPKATESAVEAILPP